MLSGDRYTQDRDEPVDRELAWRQIEENERWAGENKKKQKRTNDTMVSGGLRLFPVGWYGERVYCIWQRTVGAELGLRDRK